MATTTTIKYKLTRADAYPPIQMTKGSAGYDLSLPTDIDILNHKAYERAVTLDLGVAFDIPKGFVGLIYLRSSIGRNTSLRLSNGTGVIDSDYKKSIHLMLDNIGNERVVLPAGTRIAQIIFTAVPSITLKAQDFTDSGRGGLGSTGTEHPKKEENK